MMKCKKYRPFKVIIKFSSRGMLVHKSASFSFRKLSLWRALIQKPSEVNGSFPTDSNSLRVKPYKQLELCMCQGYYHDN